MPSSYRRRSIFKNSLSGQFRKTVLMGLLTMTSLTGCMSMQPRDKKPQKTPEKPTPVQIWTPEETALRDECTNPWETVTDTTEVNTENDLRVKNMLNQIETKGGADDGKALITFLRDDAPEIRICIEDLPTGFYGYFSPQTQTVNLNKDSDDSELIATLIHELVHSYQYHQKAVDSSAYTQDIHFALASELSAEASAESVAIRISHEMKENGTDTVWNAYKNNFPAYQDMVTRYENVYDAHKEKDGHTAAAAHATKAAYDQYFKSQWRLNTYNAKAIAATIIAYGQAEENPAYIDRAQTDKEVQAMAKLPSGQNYTADATAMTEEQIFGTEISGTFFHLVAAAFEAHRKGENTETNEETMEEFGLFAGLDFKAAYQNFIATEKTPDMFAALFMQIQEQGIPEKLQAYRVQKLLESGGPIIIIKPQTMTPSTPETQKNRHFGHHH